MPNDGTALPLRVVARTRTNEEIGSNTLFPMLPRGKYGWKANFFPQKLSKPA